MRQLYLISIAALVAAFAPQRAATAQDNPTGDPVVQRIYDEGMRRSQTSRLAQVLMDSIGPRLTGSPANRAANDWLLRMYRSWGIDAKNEQYGTWRDWTRGPSQLTLVAPRTRVLEATMHAWSGATPAGGVTADVVTPAIHRARPLLSRSSPALGRMTTSAVTPPAGVAPLHACIVASSTRVRGATSVS